MTFLITYYVIGLVLSVLLLLATWKFLGEQGVYQLYREEYRNTKLSVKEVYVYFHIAVMAILPIFYGVWILEAIIDYAFKKLAPNKKS
jgi:hypothetical protein